MNRILSHNEHTGKMESAYYHTFSGDRYTNVEYTRSKFLLPFKKEYIRRISDGVEKKKDFPGIIGTIIKNTLKIKRFDVLSYYQDHNNSPSVRSLHTARLLFIIRGQIYYYSMYDNKMLCLSKDVIETVCHDRFYIIGLSDVLNLTRYYGEFSLYASILDAGHLLYNVKNTLIGSGEAFQLFRHFPVKRIYEKASIDPNTTYLSFALAISETEMSWDDCFSVVDGYDERLTLGYDELHGSYFLRNLLDDYNERTVMEANRIESEGIPYLEVPSMLTRTSAHTTVGNNNFAETFDDFDPAEVLDLIKRSGPMFSNRKTDYCFLVKNEGKESIYWSDFSVTDRPIDYRSTMYNAYKFFDMHSYRFILVCFTKTSHLATSGLVDHIISAGEIMQLTASYAGLKGYAFRPMKNHHDRYLKEVLSLGDDTEINFMGVVCNSPIHQLSEYV
ncbi:MAG TPA: hypothetical protein VK111_09280 [Virgibacillus sp.]|nr:hypothetical protein [Virgibacillus sp.]